MPDAKNHMLHDDILHWEMEMWAGDKAYERSDYHLAEQMLEEAFKDASRFTGSESFLAETIDDLILVYCTEGRFADAERLYKKQLALHKLMFGEIHPRVAKDLHQFAMFYAGLSDNNRAEPLLEQALAVREQLYGPFDDRTAETRSELVAVMEELRHYEKAEALLLNVIAQAGQSDSVANALVHSQALESLAEIYLSQARPDKAEWALKDALSTYEKKCGPSSRHVANCLSLLAPVLRQLDHRHEAQAVEIRARRILEPNSP